MDTSKINIGQFLRKLREVNNMTLHQVSKETDIDSPLLSKIERGKRLPTSDQIAMLAKFYNLQESELKAKVVAEKIIKNYGLNDTTFEALNIVKEQIIPYLKNE